MNFNRIKKNYENGLWTKDMVKIAVQKGIINQVQYKLITGEAYEGGGDDGN